MGGKTDGTREWNKEILTDKIEDAPGRKFGKPNVALESAWVVCLVYQLTPTPEAGDDTLLSLVRG